MSKRTRVRSSPDGGFTLGLLILSAGLAVAVVGLVGLTYRQDQHGRWLQAQLDDSRAECRLALEQGAEANGDDQLRSARLWSLLELLAALRELDERDFGTARARLLRAARHLRQGGERGDVALAARISAIELGAETDLGMATRVLDSIRGAIEAKLPAGPDRRPAF
ncbi:MAG: hypothetical protein AAF602_26750 [Myxococcota bacterium]